MTSWHRWKGLSWQSTYLNTTYLRQHGGWGWGKQAALRGTLEMKSWRVQRQSEGISVVADRTRRLMSCVAPRDRRILWRTRRVRKMLKPAFTFRLIMCATNHFRNRRKHARCRRTALQKDIDYFPCSQNYSVLWGIVLICQRSHSLSPLDAGKQISKWRKRGRCERFQYACSDLQGTRKLVRALFKAVPKT